jgi:hypothetical protein
VLNLTFKTGFKNCIGEDRNVQFIGGGGRESQSHMSDSHFLLTSKKLCINDEFAPPEQIFSQELDCRVFPMFTAAHFRKVKMFERTSEFCIMIMCLHRQQSQRSNFWPEDKHLCLNFNRSSLICPLYPETKPLFAMVSFSATRRCSEQWDHSGLTSKLVAA